MTTYFSLNKKRLLARYNKRLWKASLPAVFTMLTILAAALLTSRSLQPPAYYRAIFIILAIVLIYTFAVVCIGSLFTGHRLESHLIHTYVQLKGEMLIVSRYEGSSGSGKTRTAYKKLYLIRLGEIEDVYCYRRNVVIIAPTRLLAERADWLSISNSDNPRKIGFDNWWYEENGGRLVNGTEITDMFSFPSRIEKTILAASGKVQQKDLQRRKFKEKMLSIAKSNTMSNMQ